MQETCTKGASQNSSLNAELMNNAEIDRIGSLPDEVLTHILSFLSTKEAVQTCVLSKRWKNTWAAVPVLHIKNKDYSLFVDDDCSVDYNEALRMSGARFDQLMTGFMDNRLPTNLERVCCVLPCWETHAFMGWLDRVLLLMPLHIDIIISNWSDNSLDLLDLVFSCASLQHLSMSLWNRVKIIIGPESINLPYLKFLELNHIELPDEFSQKLFMGCPSLERLILRCCALYLSDISSEVLKELTLHECHLYEKMQISCPHLVSLFMGINLRRGSISLKNTPSLVNIVLKLYWYIDNEVPVLNLFGGLSNAAKLELYLYNPVLREQLEKDIPNCRNFNNLKKLVVGGWDMSYDFYLIACLLKHSPNLKELNLVFDEFQCLIEGPRRKVSRDVLFPYEYLETVKIETDFWGGFSSKLINTMIKTLGSYVKKIGNLIIA